MNLLVNLSSEDLYNCYIMAVKTPFVGGAECASKTNQITLCISYILRTINRGIT